MSILALLASGSTGVPVEPVVDGYGTLGALTATMRPTWGRVIPVGPARTFTTIGAAITEARLEPYAQPGMWPRASAGELNVLARGLRPYKHRVLLALDPGTYDLAEILDAGDGVDLAGTGDDPSDVQIRTSTINYSLRTYGSMYVRNLTLWHDEGGTGNNYPYHGSNIAGVSRPTNVFDNVWFRDTNTGSSGSAGWDLSNGQTAIFYRCRFTTTRETGYVTNLHDMPDNTLGVDVAFIDCVHETGEDIGVRYLNPPYKGRVWVQGCTLPDLTPIPDSLEIDDGTPGPITIEPPIPAAAMSDGERERYEPEAASGATLATDLGTTSTVSLVAGRTYYVPLGDLPWSCVIDLAQAEVVTSGSVAVGLFLERPDLRPGQPSGPLVWQAMGARSPGILSAPTQNPYGVLGLDRGMRVWIGVRTDGVATLTGYAAAGATPCWYEDSASLTAFPSASLAAVDSGDPVPWGQLVAL